MKYLMIEKNTNKYKKLLGVFGDYLYNEEGELQTEFIPKHLTSYEIFEQPNDWTSDLAVYNSETKTWHKYDDVRFELDEANYKKELKVKYSKQAFEERQKNIPDYRLQNLLLGIVYDDYTKEQALQLVEDYRTEYYRLASLIDNATSQTDIDNIEPNWPTL